jgi:hypothetical protein
MGVIRRLTKQLRLIAKALAIVCCQVFGNHTTVSIKQAKAV